MRFRSRTNRRATKETVPAGTRIFVGKPATPLPPELLTELAAACAADGRIQAAYVFMLYIQLPGEVPHHSIGLSVEDRVGDLDFEAVVDALWSRIAALAPAEAPIDFERLSETNPPPDSVPPFFTRTS